MGHVAPCGGASDRSFLVTRQRHQPLGEFAMLCLGNGSLVLGPA